MPYDYVSYYIDWLRRPEEDYLLCVVTSTQPASGDVPQDQRTGVVSYAEGYLNSAYDAYGMTGAVNQYFSDRRSSGVGGLTPNAVYAVSLGTWAFA